MVKRRNPANPSRQRRRVRRTHAMDREMVEALIVGSAGAKQLPVYGEVTALTFNPKVQRWVRMSSGIDMTTRNISVTPALVITTDANQYNILVARYRTVRFLRIRAWNRIEDKTVGITMIDAVSSATFTDAGQVGASLPCVAYRYPRVVSDRIFGNTDTTTITTIGAPNLTTGSVLCTFDCFVEFE
jgi:hypothetical protein